MTSSIVSSEKAKYEHAWSHPIYRSTCHGLSLWRNRRDLYPTPMPSTAIDLGCGTGRLLYEWRVQGIDAYGVDIADNSLDEKLVPIIGDYVVQSPLWDMEWNQIFGVGSCTDVMEHIPPNMVEQTLKRISEYCNYVVFKIAHSPSVLISDQLHLTVEPPSWWLSTMKETMGGTVIHEGYQLRSGLQDSLITWRRKC